MAIQHRDITGNDVHEPKGIENATNGLVYVANGTGSGTWKKLATNGIEGFPAGTPLANQVLVTNGSGGLQLGGTPIFGVSQIRNTGFWGTLQSPWNTGVPPGAQSLISASGMTLVNGGLRATQAGWYRFEIHFQGSGQVGTPTWARLRLRKNGTTLTANSFILPSSFNGEGYGINPSNVMFTDFIQLAVTEYVEPVVEYLGNNSIRFLQDYRVQVVAELVR